MLLGGRHILQWETLTLLRDVMPVHPLVGFERNHRLLVCSEVNEDRKRLAVSPLYPRSYARKWAKSARTWQQWLRE